MTNFKRKVMAVGMACFLSAGAFAQKKGEDKQRPPKDTPKVVVKEKPPPQNNNQGGKKNEGKKGKG